MRRKLVKILFGMPREISAKIFENSGDLAISKTKSSTKRL